MPPSDDPNLLLAHFDLPMPFEMESVCLQAPRLATASSEQPGPLPPRRIFDPNGEGEHTVEANVRKVRGVRWVLQWAAVVGTLFVSSCILLVFGFRLAAELQLARAARAGI